MVKGLVKVMFAVVVMMFAAAVDTNAQGYQRPAQVINLSGPRVGVTFLNPGVRDWLRENADVEIGPVISQFGWQKEKRFMSSPNGFTGVTEFVLLFGGVDQGVVLPSFNWLVGARTASGVEFAAGPNLTPSGLGMAIAAGITFQTGNLNVPVNFAFVPSRTGARVSMLVGFNMRRP